MIERNSSCLEYYATGGGPLLSFTISNEDGKEENNKAY